MHHVPPFDLYDAVGAIVFSGVDTSSRYSSPSKSTQN